MNETKQPISPLPSLTPTAAKDSLDFIIAEYSALREEILKRTEIQHQLIAIALVASGTFLSFTDTEATAAYPILALFLSAAWSQSDIRIQQIGSYIREHIEERMIREGLLDERSGWQHVFKALSASGTAGTRVRWQFILRPRRHLTLSRLTSYGILIGTQLLAIILLLHKKNLLRTNFGRWDTTSRVELAFEFMIVILTAFLLRGSQRWFSDV